MLLVLITLRTFSSICNLSFFSKYDFSWSYSLKVGFCPLGKASAAVAPPCSAVLTVCFVALALKRCRCSWTFTPYSYVMNVCPIDIPGSGPVNGGRVFLPLFNVTIAAKCLGFCTGFALIFAFVNMKGALPRSKAGDRSTSLGIIPLFKSENIPSWMSFSVIGGGSANGSSLKCLGRILFGPCVLPAYLCPIPSLSSSRLLMPP